MKATCSDIYMIREASDGYLLHMTNNQPYFKYPRTPHLPWSPGVDSDDLRLLRDSMFEDREVVVTEKMDGECTTMYPGYIHARSIDSRHHPSRDWVKALHGSIAHHIPKGWRLCGENMYAQHSIVYSNLESYFYLFSVWDDCNICLSWDDVTEWAEFLGMATPEVVYRGLWDAKAVQTAALPLTLGSSSHEGYVVRVAGCFAYQEFHQHVAKWVRANHVQTDIHWMHKQVVPNGLRGKS